MVLMIGILLSRTTDNEALHETEANVSSLVEAVLVVHCLQKYLYNHYRLLLCTC